MSKPRTISKTAWYYAEETKLTVVVEHRIGDNYCGTMQVEIPYRAIAKDIHAYEARKRTKRKGETK